MITNNNVLYTRLNIGIGDLIYSKSLLLGYPGMVEIRLAYEYLNYRGPGYKSFLDDFSKRLFYEQKFSIVDDANYLPESWWRLYEQGLTPSQICLRDAFCYGNTLQKPFVCIHVKVRGDFGNSMNRKDFDSYWPRIKDALNDISSSFILVVLGEREIEKNDEYDKHSSDTIFSWYELTSELKNTIDMTVNGLSSPSMDKFRQDCMYKIGRAHV